MVLFNPLSTLASGHYDHNLHFADGKLRPGVIALVTPSPVTQAGTRLNRGRLTLSLGACHQATLPEQARVRRTGQALQTGAE